MPISSRQRILAVATTLLAREGPGLTMRTLGDAVGLDNSSLYRHFPSKAALVREVLAGAADEVVAPLAVLAVDHPPRLATLVDAAAELVGRLAERPDPARLVLAWIAEAPARAAAGRRDDADAPPARALLALVDWLTRARRSGAIRRVHVNEAAVALLGGILVRAATAGALLATGEGGEGDATAPVARRARVRETAAFVAGALRPGREDVPLRGA